MQSKHRNSKNSVGQLWWWYIDKHMNNYSRVKPANIMKLKHHMHDGLSIYQDKYFKTTFLSPTPPILVNIQS